MLNRTIISITALFILFSCAINAGAQTYNGISITDFTIHKVKPEKSPAKQVPTSEQVKKVEKKPLTSVKTVKKVIHPAPQPVVTRKHITKPVVTQKRVKPIVTKRAPVQKKQEIPVKEVKDLETPVIREEQQKTGFDKDEYAKNLNKFLNEEKVGQNEVKVVEETKPNSFDYIVRPSMSLAVVLFFILILAWMYSKIKGVTPSNPFFGKFGDADVNKFKVLATSTLGQGKVIHLVEINGKQLVVGSTNNNINLLTEISPDELEELKAKANKKNIDSDSQANKYHSEDPENYDPEIYSAKYSELYKEYIEKENSDK